MNKYKLSFEAGLSTRIDQTFLVVRKLISRVKKFLCKVPPPSAKFSSLSLEQANKKLNRVKIETHRSRQLKRIKKEWGRRRRRRLAHRKFLGASTRVSSSISVVELWWTSPAAKLGKMRNNWSTLRKFCVLFYRSRRHVSMFRICFIFFFKFCVRLPNTSQKILKSWFFYSIQTEAMTVLDREMQEFVLMVFVN